MACRWFAECLLKVLNFLLTLAGLGMVGYGIYMLVEWKRASVTISSEKGEGELLRLGRPLLLIASSLSSSILDKLPAAWFIYLFMAVGVIVCIISCSGCIAVATRRGCCLCCYSVLITLLVLVELGFVAFIIFDHKWEEVIPTDKTGDFDMIKEFLEKNLKIVKWVALGIVILQVFAMVLALAVKAASRGPEYDSDDEYITPRASMLNQPLLNRPGTQVPAVSTPVPEQRPARNDAWSTRMREKYGLDTSEFTYNPTDSTRYPQQAPPPSEQRSRCTIM
uniref:TSA: Wollemia nobilis Ref_Wollemi_Transcript_10720_1565 transcribed RNA sequence n=1 Tax=Wollemia nobilis TaxID=56998 RepID=A0A0C9RMK1_9CONI